MSRTYRRVNSFHKLSIIVDRIKSVEISNISNVFSKQNQLLEYPYKFIGLKKSDDQKFVDKYFRDGGRSEKRRGCDCWVCNPDNIKQRYFKKQSKNAITNHKKGLDEEDYFDLYSCDCFCEECVESGCKQFHINNIESFFL